MCTAGRTCPDGVCGAKRAQTHASIPHPQAVRPYFFYGLPVPGTPWQGLSRCGIAAVRVFYSLFHEPAAALTAIVTGKADQVHAGRKAAYIHVVFARF